MKSCNICRQKQKHQNGKFGVDFADKKEYNLLKIKKGAIKTGPDKTKGVPKMATRYTKDKDHRFSFRVNDALFNWVNDRAKKLGVSPCDLVRSYLFQQMSAEATLAAINNDSTADRRRDCEVKNHANNKKHI